jgi:hypothetical protein
VTICYDFKARLRSYELLASAYLARPDLAASTPDRPDRPDQTDLSDQPDSSDAGLSRPRAS